MTTDQAAAPPAIAEAVPDPAPLTGAARLGEIPPAQPVRPKDPARLAVRAHLTTHVRALLEQEDRVRAGGEDSVHKMRVAARRLRSGLRTFRPLLDEAWAAHLGEELRWAAHGLGAARDLEVLAARLDAAAGELPEAALAAATRDRIGAVLGPELAEARSAAIALLDSVRYVRLVTDLVAAATAPRTTKRAEAKCRAALPPLMAAAYARLRLHTRNLRLDPPGTVVPPDSDAAWHSARIQAKKARYAAEACEPVFGKPAGRLAGQLTRVTETLGEHQDAAVAADAVVDLGRRPDTPALAALGLGILHGRQRDAVLAARAEFVRIWPEVAAKRWRRWL